MAKDVKTVFPDSVIGTEKVFEVDHARLRVKTFGVTSLLFDDGKTQILFDAMVSRPPMLTAFMGKFDSNAALVKTLVEQNHMGNLAAVFVSHSHYDHVLDVPAFAKLTGAEVYGSRSTLNVVRGNGVEEARLHEFSVGNTYEVGDFSIKIMKALHSPAKFYNDDLGKEIPEPVTYPATMKQLPEGGSYDFYVTYGGKSFLIHPSCNYIPGAFDGMAADVIFLGVGQLGKMKADMKDRFYRETVGALKPSLVLPVHWDVFFYPLHKADYAFTVFDKAIDGLGYVAERLKKDGIHFEILQATKAV